MTLYELIKQISEILTPETDSFYNYALYTSDDNGGFLRTRYCWWEKPVDNKKLGKKEYKKVMVTMGEPFDEKKLTIKEDTLVKMQITYGVTNATIDDAEWDIQLGYRYVYIFDLQNKTYALQQGDKLL